MPRLRVGSRRPAWVAYCGGPRVVARTTMLGGADGASDGVLETSKLDQMFHLGGSARGNSNTDALGPGGTGSSMTRSGCTKELAAARVLLPVVWALRCGWVGKFFRGFTSLETSTQFERCAAFLCLRLPRQPTRTEEGALPSKSCALRCAGLATPSLRQHCPCNGKQELGTFVLLPTARGGLLSSTP